ncbi:MAG: sulfotransferase [Candidatus Heimdallarchaeum aukensis]|uniref:Sulfotransferase n=1 Tax=Candidatus Heimdallarchaeum aukensis TaxID=2876573 RepID=A0A9Y1BML6_9ARCH|nr:MAG: sulfotransferase [Candidatus Heimdallarchaeum aukensis]
MPKVSFFCIGAQKAGTTTIHSILKQHPKLCLPDIKETRFFDLDRKFKKGLDWYFSTFFKCDESSYLGEVAPEYLYYKQVPKRIYNAFGNGVKFILIVRDPVERAYSHYLMNVRRGYEKLTFEEAIQREIKELNANHPYYQRYNYLEKGMYYLNIQKYLDFFHKKNFIIFNFEYDLCLNIKKMIDKLFSFLDIPKYDLNLNILKNEAYESKNKFIRDFIYKDNFAKKIIRCIIPDETFRYKLSKLLMNFNKKPLDKKKINVELKEKLINEYFLDDIIKFEKLFEIDLHNWYSFDE